MQEVNLKILEDVKKRYSVDRRMTTNAEMDISTLENINSKIYKYSYDYLGKEFMNSPTDSKIVKKVSFEMMPTDTDFKLLQKQINSVSERKDFIEWLFI